MFGTSEKMINSQIQKNKKNSRRFLGILRRLAESEGSVINKIKVTVYKEDSTEEKDHVFLAPSTFKNYSEHYMDKISSENTSENLLDSTAENSKNSNEVKRVSNDIETEIYPDSSDFSDDE